MEHATPPTRQTKVYGARGTRRTAQRGFGPDILWQDESIPREKWEAEYRKPPVKRRVRQVPTLSVTDKEYHLDRFTSDGRQTRSVHQLLGVFRWVSDKMSQIDCRLKANELVGEDIGYRSEKH